MNKLNKTLLCENIDRIAKYDFSRNKVFGSAYFVYQEGCLALEKCYGKVSLGSDTPVTNTTLFRLASMTKPITAAAALILIDRGLLSLDDKVDKFLPSFKVVSVTDGSGNSFPPNNLPTVRNLLTHSAGIASNCDKLTDMTAKDMETVDNSIAYYINKGLDFEPGTAQMYSGTGAFDVLVKIIETVTGTDFLSFLKKEIFEPLEMYDTTFTPTAEQKSRIIEMHQKVDGENAIFKMHDGYIFEDFPCTHFLGGAGLVSTLHDYRNFAEMLLYKGKTENTKLFKEETFQLLCTPQISKDIMQGNERWGLGVRVITEPDYLYLPVGTFGWSGAYGTHFWIDPVNRIFAIFMKNSQVDGGAGNESARNFEKAVYSSF